MVQTATHILTVHGARKVYVYLRYLQILLLVSIARRSLTFFLCLFLHRIVLSLNYS
jgi:hypothetical protein